MKLQPQITHRRQTGLTFIELIIGLVVLAIALSWALPNLRGPLARNQMLGQANTLAGALALARNEAVTRGFQTGVCASSDGTACSTSAADWTSHYLVFVDEDGGSDFDNTEPLLKSYSSHAEVSQTATVPAFYFTPSGYSSLTAVNSIQVCHEHSEESNRCRQVTISPGGTISIKSSTQTQES